MSGANPARGEAAFTVGGVALVLRPSFEALVAAEEELGPLLPLVERAAGGALKLSETASLIWHCVRDRPAQLTRERIGAVLGWSADRFWRSTPDELAAVLEAAAGTAGESALERAELKRLMEAFPDE